MIDIKTNPPKNVIQPPSSNLIRLATKNALSTIRKIPTIKNANGAGTPLKRR
jgi:hypothetical protein